MPSQDYLLGSQYLILKSTGVAEAVLGEQPPAPWSGSDSVLATTHNALHRTTNPVQLGSVILLGISASYSS